MNLLKTITNENNTSFEKFLLESIEKSAITRIASGYIGIDVFRKTEPFFRKKIEQGGVVTLIFGLGKWEGISPKLEVLLRDFHTYAKNKNEKSGVYFCQKDKYHGKIYLFKNKSDEWASVGSSNFSPTGLGGYQEANVEIRDQKTISEINQYFDRLYINNAKPINLIIFPSKEKELLAKEKYEKIDIQSNFRDLPIAFKLQIKPHSKSHINLFAGIGRLNRQTGIYSKRPWYEVELGVTVEEVIRNLQNFLPDQKSPYYIKIVDDDGNIMNANFKRKTGGSHSEKTLREIGLDFMTGNGEDSDGGKNGRIQLGIFIKNKLIDAGLIKYGEIITEDILDIYGNHHLEFREFPGKKDFFFITFDAK
jgi:hypothetical protein